MSPTPFSSSPCVALNTGLQMPLLGLGTYKLCGLQDGEKAMEGALHSWSQLDLDYIDLYLIHWPGTQGLPVGDERNPGNRAQSWASLEELHGQGKLRNIGVSNYTPAHMRALMQSCKVPPAVLQVEHSREEHVTYTVMVKSKHTHYSIACRVTVDFRIGLSHRSGGFVSHSSLVH
ncbi:hypothetical protein GOODEAATRI_016794 [Goodea atripinnis]|uniref:NADP-dependent oxidoreductase domain-containing protein n=1 Tax=Goodea atripinnis TaxID=208336 RepID=A0ABV0NWH8_9TELE